MREVAEMAEPWRPPRQHFVLVHGLGGGAWCWYKIRTLMENSGYGVSCIDLKSAGIDPSNADSILSFDDYNKPLMDFMSSLPETEQVRIARIIKPELIIGIYPRQSCRWISLAGDTGGA